MKNQMGLRFFVVFMTAGFLLVNYENCSSKIGFKDLDNASLGQTYYDLGKCVNGCIKNEIDAAQNVAKPHVKVVMVVDNSSSMAANQASLASGVKSLINDLSGIDTNFYLYSTTQESNGAKSVTTTSQGCRDTDTSGNFVPCSSSSPQAGHTYSNFNQWSLAPSLMPPVHLAANASQQEFENIKSELAQNIIGVGTNGYPNEQGICTLARTVYETGPNQIFSNDAIHTDGPDVAAFIVISDDNDKTRVAKDGSINSQCHSHEESAKSCTLDTTPVPNGGSQNCTDPSCTYYNVSYTSTLSRNPIPDAVIYNYSTTKLSPSQVVHYKTQAPPTNNIVMNITYSQGSVNVTYKTQVRSFDGQYVSWNNKDNSLSPYDVASCDPSDFNAASECNNKVNGLGLNSANERFVVGSCAATCDSTPQHTTIQKYNASSCEVYPTSGSADCSTENLVTSQLSGRKILSCAGTCQVSTSNPISQSLNPVLVSSCSPSSTCNGTQLAQVQSAFNFIPGSCSVSCDAPQSRIGSALAPSSVSCSQAGSDCKNASTKNYLQGLGVNYFGSDEDFSASDYCSVSCAPGSTPSPIVTLTVRQNQIVENVNYCNSSFKAPNGATYDSIEKYFEVTNGMTSGSCTRTTADGPKYDQVAVGGTHPANTVVCAPVKSTAYSFPPDQPIAPGQDVSNSFMAKARERFQSNFLVSALVSTQTISWYGDQVSKCADHTNTLWAPIGIGQRYMDLVNQPGNKGTIESVCAPDYGVSLSKISDWVKTTTNQIYLISGLGSSSNPIVIEVWVSNSSGHHTMVIGQDVEINGSTLKFLRDGTIQPGDRIGYTLANQKK